MMTILKHLRAVAATGVLALALAGTASAADPTPGQSFRPCDQCPEMVDIPVGTVTAGNPKDFENPEPDAPKRPTITIKRPYALGKFEVTQAEWTAIMGSNPSENKSPQNPVDHVDWKMTQDFIRKLNQKTGKTYRLPNEAEWEIAALGGNKSKGYTYSGGNSLSNVAWFFDNSSSKTHPVAQLQPNELGIYDMSGNVWEWCSDWYGNYSGNAQTNPKGPSLGLYRVYRGGYWNADAQSCRTANRYFISPDSRYYFLGFRLVSPK
jgi:formylglycine-generating enzyme required for sulfatase activity